MDLSKDIERATYIPSDNSNVRFVPKNKPKQRMKTKQRHFPNSELLQDTVPDYKSVPQSYQLNSYEISAAIRRTNGTISLSNSDIKNHWKAKCMESKLCSEIHEDASSANSTDDSIKCDSWIRSKENNNGNSEPQESETVKKNKKSEEENDPDVIIKLCKFERNVALKGLIKNQVISAKDLNVPYTVPSKQIKRSSDTNSEINVPESKNTVTHTKEEFSQTQYVPHPEDPEILITSLQAGGTIDETKYKNINFDVPRLGKKTELTPLQYLIHEVDDSCFNFVQNKPKSM